MVSEPGGCLNAFELVVGNHSLGGDLIVDADDVEECKTWCRDRNWCYGFDYDKNQTSCYSHTEATIDNTRSDRRVIDQYRKLACGVTTSPPGQSFHLLQ